MKALKEIGRRVVLTDIVDDFKETNKKINDSDEHRAIKVADKVANGFRCGLRVFPMRAMGDIVALAAAHQAVVDPEYAPAYIVSGLLAFAGTYLLDYAIFDKLGWMDPTTTLYESVKNLGK